MISSPPLWAGLVINFLVSFIGVIVFILLCRGMRRADIPAPPYFPFFILFSVFGGALVMILTVLFWEWSGMASLGMLYLVGFAPFATAILTFRLRKQRGLSAFHRGAYVASVTYAALGFAALAAFVGVAVWRLA